MTTIVLGKKSRRLEEISVRDSLVFPDKRMEKVVEINPLFREIHVERTEVNLEKDYDKFPMKKQKIIYELGSKDLMTGASIGRVYDSKKINKVDWMLIMENLGEKK
jgi:hypothetical protein